MNRQEQLRAAKHRQRLRDRKAGQALYQLKLPTTLRDRLKVGIQSVTFVAHLHAFLRREVVRVADYSGLALLCWNQDIEYVTRGDAFQIYERNWRFVDVDTLTADERALIEELKEEFGSGVLNA